MKYGNCKKIDHSKDEYYLTFAMRNYRNMMSCPLDNKLIKNGYIADKGMLNHGFQNSDNRQFKCFSLHPMIGGKDIVPYTYGNIGYDLNPESMRIYVGGWRDLRSNNNANVLANDKLLSTKKNGNLYLGEDHVDKIMYKKILNRATLLRDAIKQSTNKDPKKILQLMFGKSNKNDDDSFCEDNYTLEKIENSNIWKLTGKQVNCNANDTFHDNYGVRIDGNFELLFDEDKDKIHFVSNELNGIAKDKTKGIKVDRIFVKEAEDETGFGLNGLKKRQEEANQEGGNQKHKTIYNDYINQLTDVLIQQFPFGEIRVVKGDIYKGQENVFLSPEEFINKYFVNEKDKNKYLEKLNSKKEEVKKKQKFKDILNGFNLIKEKLGEGEAKNDPKSRNNKIFLNKKWYDRAHWTETSIVKSQINKVFDSYVRGKINDEDAKRQLNNIVNSHQRFFNSIYC